MSCLIESLYRPPDNGMLAPEEVSKHIKDKLNPFMNFIKSSPVQLLAEGKKTVVDHNGEIVEVRGTMLDGMLMG